MAQENYQRKGFKIFGLVDKKLNEIGYDYLQVSIDTCSVISDWYHYAILELTYVSGFKANPNWIVKKLSITVEESKSAVERLKRLGLLLVLI